MNGSFALDQALRNLTDRLRRLEITVARQRLIPGGNTTYDPTTSGLTATDLQAAVDEIQAEIEALPAVGTVEILDEGSSLTSALASMNFTGAGVTATASGDDVTVTIPAGGSPNLDGGSPTSTYGGTTAIDGGTP